MAPFWDQGSEFSDMRLILVYELANMLGSQGMNQSMDLSHESVYGVCTPRGSAVHAEVAVAQEAKNLEKFLGDLEAGSRCAPVLHRGLW